MRFVLARAVAIGGVVTTLVAASLPGTASAAAFTPDSWTPGQSEPNPRLVGTSVPLADGRIVVAGGMSLAGGSGSDSPIDVLDRYTNTWTSTPYRSFYGAFAQATGDQDVVVGGGLDMAGAGSFKSAAQVYSTSGSAGTFTLAGTATMTTPRAFSASAQLPDGRVLVVGGAGDSGPLSSAEIFNGATKTFGAAADSGVLWMMPKALTLSNGKVLVAGGVGMAGDPIATARLYNPITNTWSTAGAMHTPRVLFSMTPLLDGRVLVAGGETGTAVTSAAELYDPVANTWTVTASMSRPRSEHAATKLTSGVVLVAGGATAVDESGTADPYSATAAAEVFDPYVGAWKAIAPLPGPLLYPEAVVGLNSAAAVVYGGVDLTASTIGGTFLYHPAAAPTAYPATRYHAIAPGRVLDTRPTGSGNTNIGLASKLTANTPRAFKVTGVIPTGATKVAVPVGAKAVTGNLTVVNQSAGGSLVLGPVASAWPSTSTLSFPVGDIRANNVTVALRSDGTLAIDYAGPAGATTNAIFDVTGYFLDAASDTTGGTLHTVAPGRVLDSRPTGSGHTNIGLAGKFLNRVARSFQVAGVKPVGGTVALVPSNAVAVTGNITVVNQTSGGYVAIGPTMANNPTTSTLNVPLKDIRANGVTVALSAGRLSAVWAGTAGSSADILFDVTGYFTADTTGAKFYPIDPVRMLDSRAGNGLSGVFANRVPRTLTLGGRGMPPAQQIPATAAGIAGNLTLVGETSGGYAFISPVATSTPTSSTLNAPAGDARANGFDVALASGKLGIVWAGTTGSSTNVILDVTGYWK